MLFKPYNVGDKVKPTRSVERIIEKVENGVLLANGYNNFLRHLFREGTITAVHDDGSVNVQTENGIFYDVEPNMLERK